MSIKVGDKAPEFTAKAVHEREEVLIHLKDFQGKKVALYFYPKDLTPGCTTQAENLRDNITELTDNNIVVIGVSTDSCKSHKLFQEKKALPFVLVSDEEKEIVEKYGVWVEKSMYGKKYFGIARTTFLLDEKGVVVQIIDKPKVGEHAKEILKCFS
ncbi:thioredoxin-dependent thiol peroxidase [Candidatus Woesearchaeota archaeon]|nr:thioredoxin-dependent thiol peroxidase [Nanoarchaeota archaeon]MCB9370564.1 thioredoxin-dependent thiol peroxidase [Candidatus Woesearchaeota archaeon]USN44957.1 MAG: thioredoxin-dependent thiol peroxidase [Candidatus Woesearchaeota archaeon]